MATTAPQTAADEQDESDSELGDRLWPLPALLWPAVNDGGEEGRGEANQPDATDQDDSPEPGRAQTNALLRRVIGERLVAARRVNGWDQSTFAAAMSLPNSTQASLWERGLRLPPLSLLIQAARVLGVSLDFLVAESDEFDRDPKLAARAATFRRVERLLRVNAEAVAQCLLDACSSPAADEIRVTKFASRARALCDAVDRFRELNSDLFDNARGGATLLRTAEDLRRSLGQVDRFLARSAYARAGALSKATALTRAHVRPDRNLQPQYERTCS